MEQSNGGNGKYVVLKLKVRRRGERGGIKEKVEFGGGIKGD